MYQNVSDNTVDDDSLKENKINLLLKELFKPHNIIIYIITFLVSMVEIRNEILPFGLAIVAACMGSTIPIFMVYVVSIISVAIFHGMAGCSSYFYTSLIFFLLIFMFKPKVFDYDRNEVFKVGTRLFFSSFIYFVLKNIKGTFLASDVFFGFIISALTYTFYKIFVNGIVVIRDITKKRAFTVEEVIAASILLAISFSVFKDIRIFELSIVNIFVVFLIMVLGWKNGIIIGGTSGLALGATLTLIGNINSFQLLIFLVSGILAGLLSKLGKIGVIGGFALVIALLTYLNNGNEIIINYLKEIFVATIGLIIVPSNFKIAIEELISKEKLLGNLGEHRLNYYEEIKEKISAVAQTITDMNNNFFIKNNEETDNMNKEVYVENFLDLLEDYSNNIFYEDLVNNESLIGDFFESLVKEDVITEKETLEIFRKYNNYILLRDQKLKDDLQEIIKIANRTYKELQFNQLKVKVKKEEAKKLENELKNVSNIITNISTNSKENNDFNKKEKEIITLLKGKMYQIKTVKVDMLKNGKYVVELKFETSDNLRDRNIVSNIEGLISKSLGTKVEFQKDKKNVSNSDYVQVYSSEDRFALQVGSSKISKDGNGGISGDSNLTMRLNDGKYLLAISDGMGSGEKAKKASKFVINSLNTLLSKGFEQDETIKLINSELNFNKDSEMYATVDMSILDLYKGNILISKNGGCNTYIKSKKGVKVYSGKNLPVGIVEDAGLELQEAELEEGDIILMSSDGLLESKDESKKDWIQEFLNNINTNNVQKISDLITSEAIDNSYGLPKDDITVIVARIIKKK